MNDAAPVIRAGQCFRNLAGTYSIVRVDDRQVLYSFSGHANRESMLANMPVAAFRRLAARATRVPTGAAGEAVAESAEVRQG